VLLSFSKEAEHLLFDDRWQVKPAPPTLLRQDGLTQLLTQLNRQLPKATPTKLIMVEREPNLAWQAILTDGRYANFNPYSGELLAIYVFEESPYGFLMAWHRWLLYNNGTDKPLRPLVSSAALILVMQLLLGLWMWFRPKNRLRRLRVNFAAKPYTMLYQLHSVIGVLLIIPLILIAFSGMSFYWPKASSAVVEGIFQQARDKPVHPTTTAIVGGTRLCLDTAYQNARQALPQGQLTRIHLPSKAPTGNIEPLKLRFKMPGQSHPYSWVWADPGSAELLGRYDASQANLVTQVWNFRYRFHIGDFYGMAIRLIWLLIALAPTFFVASGLYLFFRRIRRNRQPDN